ncbi:hypothetical protein Cgig2_003253 [Carnegiea gigantea]|uniref:DYW domain-containing protein n=1 Tax=Carnegiea gigantea TaxID=171969 RepID=A0A9Q1Q7N5_9CARY|nr:hypothetical protein Cgig2_003253 [Carnegiea gigantea]
MKFRKHRKLSSSILKNPKGLGDLIQTFTQSKNLSLGKQLHAQLIRSVRKVCNYVDNHLLNLYAKCGQVDYAHKLFDTMPQRNFVSWTAMITAYSQNSMHVEALRTFSDMRVAGESPNRFAFSSVIQAITLLSDILSGRQVHCLSLKCGLNHELFVGSNLADMYSKCQAIHDACLVFEEMPYKDEVSWTSMIHGYAKNGNFKEALMGFKNMLLEGILIDNYVLCSVLSACGPMKAYGFGESVHSITVKAGFEEETTVGNALVYIYSKVGDMGSASKVFGDGSRCMNIVSYTSLIDGFAEADQIDRALGTFVELRRQDVEPNEFTFSSLVKACANQAALEHGSQLHAQVVKMNFTADPVVSSALVFMYGKSGLVEQSARLFDHIKNPNEFAWNSLLGGYSQHGFGKEAIKVFERMVKEGIRPNEITFINLLMGCSHSGLVQQGLNIFKFMEGDYGVVPTEQHYACVIDLLSRAGKLKEAEEFINQMPFEPNAFGWCSYLGACRIHGDTARAEIAAKKLMKLEPENSAVHILLSNMYAKERQWEDVSSLRKMIKESNLKKLPGYSWVDIGNKTHVFGADDWSHPQHAEIYEKLDSLLDEIKKIGYIPRWDVIPIDTDDTTREKMLSRHSEKIAIAFAIMSLPSWKPIIIKKNLRICIDCHLAIKLMAKVTGRTIIVLVPVEIIGKDLKGVSSPRRRNAGKKRR